MKILEDLICKSEDTFNEIWFYAEKAHTLRHEHKALADTYIKIADMHIAIYNMLHERMVALIEEEKHNGIKVPPEMQSIWDYEHKRMVKSFNEAKYLVDEYKKMGY